MTSKKFSTLISELVETWLAWMKANSQVSNKALSFSERRKAAEKCEQLIKQEYQIVAQLDEYFK